ncbi:MAG TPA: thrombospondin type 3 repeat-containing protein, partial [Kofleriaceae bacterium]
MKRVRRTIFAAAISLASASCYIAIAPEGAPCDPSAPTCPAGQSCVLSTGGYVCSTGDGIRVDGGSGSSDADPNALDDDGDGIANATDNCRTLANANQANEDADTFGDACDLCPPATDNTDGDGDGVGDACDPNPTVGGDRIVVFESFDSGIPAGWTANGNYTTSGGKLLSTVSDGNQNTLVMPAMTSTRQTMYAQMTLTGIVSGQSGGALGIVDRFDTNASVGVMCGGARGNGGFLAIVNAANGL